MDELKAYKQHIQERLAGLRSVFSNASLGDFSQDVPVYGEEDEFAEVYMGVQVMVEVVRGYLQELKELNDMLALNVDELQQEIILREELEKRKDEFISLLGHELR